MSAIHDISTENPVIENNENIHSHFSDDDSENTQTMNDNHNKIKSYNYEYGTSLYPLRNIERYTR